MEDQGTVYANNRKWMSCSLLNTWRAYLIDVYGNTQNKAGTWTIENQDVRKREARSFREQNGSDSDMIYTHQ